MTDTINIWDAIRQMRRISDRKGTFSMIYMGYSITRGTSDGIVEVGKARLRPQDNPPGQYSDHMLNYTDLDNNTFNHFWQPLLMYFNNKRVTFK